jgi:hypothetical protein
MDHSLQGYLERQPTEKLLSLLQGYSKEEDPHYHSICTIIRRILDRRGIALAP